MENLSIILGFIGVIVLVFSVWTFRIVKKYSKTYTYQKNASALSDEKYFELKSRQDFIVASSTILLALISFIGISSVRDIKDEMTKQFETERRKIDTLNQVASKNFDGLELRGKNYKDSVINALKLVSVLKSRYSELSKKDILRQEIYIIDDLKIGSFKKIDHHFWLVDFNDLITISGSKLPKFKTPPSIICFSKTSSNMIIDSVTRESFRVSPFMYTDSKIAKTEDDIRFSVWISATPLQHNFSDDFSNDFF